MNCAAIPEELIESELFGHVKGAFTGAVSDRRGRFEAADGGTIFLDEIADMSLKTQAKVLRALQEQVIDPVGGAASVRVDVRVIAATNKDLPTEIRANRFREDLYFRLNVIPVFVPPLRDRDEDVPRLAAHFMGELSREYGRRPKAWEPGALAALRSYGWPGNVRELRNVIERLLIMVPGDTIAIEHLTFLDGVVRAGELAGANGPVLPLHEARERFERDYILRTLAEQQGNISRTAEVLDVERSNLYRKMRAFGIAPARRGGEPASADASGDEAPERQRCPPSASRTITATVSSTSGSSSMARAIARHQPTARKHSNGSGRATPRSRRRCRRRRTPRAPLRTARSPAIIRIRAVPANPAEDAANRRPIASTPPVSVGSTRSTGPVTGRDLGQAGAPRRSSSTAPRCRSANAGATCARSSSAARGTRPMISLSAMSAPAAMASASTARIDLGHRRRAVVGQVHRHLDLAGVLERQAERLEAGQPAVRRADGAGDVPGEREVRPIEHEVPGDQRTAGADRDRARRRMQRGRAVVRLPRRLAQPRREAGEAAAADRFEAAAVAACAPRLRRGTPGCPSVSAMARPTRVRDGDRVVHRRRAERHERQHVERADARVHAGVRGRGRPRPRPRRRARRRRARSSRRRRRT